MRLINARKLVDEQTISFEEFEDNETPEYAILSHTWAKNHEIIYQDCNTPQSKQKSGYTKIRNACHLALAQEIDWVWVDTCCIDKTSSAELTEAINSMFKWYQRAKICYVYLVDFNSGTNFHECRWFSRGWTLQELIAPREMFFYNQEWAFIGSKAYLLPALSQITTIEVDILSHKKPVSSACVAKRFSWAAKRETTRTEDLAYCLLGIFDINMPMLYGEGERAFTRLQEEIVKSTYDLSILAWTPQASSFSGFLAQSAKDFESCSELVSMGDPLVDEGEMTITSRGIRLRTLEYILVDRWGRNRYAIKLDYTLPNSSPHGLMIMMRKIGPNTFVKVGTVGTPAYPLEPDFGVSGDKQICDFTLLTKLTAASPSRLLTPGSTIVGSSRYTLVQAELPEQISVFDVSERPSQIWDLQDHSFFGTRGSLQNWGTLDLSIGALFICFWCRSDDGEWTFEGTLIESDTDGDELWNHLFLFGEKFNYQTRTVKDLLSRHQSRHKAWLKVDERTTVSFTVERMDDPILCCGPRWIVKIQRE